MSQTVVIRAPLIPPHVTDRRTLAVDTFLVVLQMCPRNARRCTPLQRTVIHRGLPPRWPQLSQIARVSEKYHIFLLEKEAFPGNTAEQTCARAGRVQKRSSQVMVLQPRGRLWMIFFAGDKSFFFCFFFRDRHPCRAASSLPLLSSPLLSSPTPMLPCFATTTRTRVDFLFVQRGLESRMATFKKNLKAFDASEV